MTMDGKCECGERFVSPLEAECGACAKCIPTLITMGRQRRDLITDLQIRYDELEAAYSEACGQNARNVRLLEIEAEGREAATRGLPSTSPYYDEEENIMWTSGWTNENVFQHLSKAVALLTWSVDCLELIKELVNSDAPEIVREGAMKLDTVVVKTNEFLEGLPE